MQSFSADFEQLILDAGGFRLQESQGSVVLQRPGKFRWETDEPFPQLLVSDGRTLWLYDRDLEQVTQKPLDPLLANTPALLLSGDLKTLDDSFFIQGPESGEQGVYRLKPKNSEAMFSVLRLYFNAGVIQEMQLEDNLGQKTSVIFNQQQLNTEQPNDTFEFVVPEGVDLIVE